MTLSEPCRLKDLSTVLSRGKAARPTYLDSTAQEWIQLKVKIIFSSQYQIAAFAAARAKPPIGAVH